MFVNVRRKIKLSFIAKWKKSFIVSKCICLKQSTAIATEKNGKMYHITYYQIHISDGFDRNGNTISARYGKLIECCSQSVEGKKEDKTYDWPSYY